MEKRIIVFIISLVMLLIQGCVTTKSYRLAPEALEGQKINEQQGIKRIVSNKKAGAVYVRSVKDAYSLDDYPGIEIGLFSEKSFEFSPESIKAFVDGKQHKIMTVDEMVTAIKDNYTAGAAAIKKQEDDRNRHAVDTSKKAPNDPEVFSPSALDSANTPGESYKSQYKYDFKSIKETKQQSSQIAEAELATLKENTEKSLKTLLSTYHVKTTVPANKWYPGEVKLAKLVEPSKPHEIKIIVNVMGDEHEFLIRSSIAE